MRVSLWKCWMVLRLRRLEPMLLNLLFVFWFLTASSGFLKRYIASTACWTHGLSEWPNHSAKSQSRAPLSCDNRRPQCPQLYAPGQDLQKDYRAMLEAMQRTCKEHAKNRKALTCYRQRPIFHPRSPWTDRCMITYGLCLWPSPGTEITVETKVQCLRYQGRNTAQCGAKPQPMGPNSASLCDTRWSRQSSMSLETSRFQSQRSLKPGIHQWLLLLPQQICWYIQFDFKCVCSSSAGGQAPPCATTA